MDINSLVLIDNPNKESKSIAYKLKIPVFEINQNLINLLIETSMLNQHKNVRFCFHKDSKSLMQKMLIFERKEMFYPPHMHKNRDESHIVFEGDLELFILNKNGAVLKRIVNSDKERKISTVPPDIHHLTRPISDYVIYLEMKNGPHKPFQDDCFIPNPLNSKRMPNKEYNIYLDSFKI